MSDRDEGSHVTREWTYARRIGGLMRCCLASLDSQMLERMEAGEGPPQDGDSVTTGCCERPLVYRDGAWEWDRKPASSDTRAAA